MAYAKPAFLTFCLIAIASICFSMKLLVCQIKEKRSLIPTNLYLCSEPPRVFGHTQQKTLGRARGEGICKYGRVSLHCSNEVRRFQCAGLRQLTFLTFCAVAPISHRASKKCSFHFLIDSQPFPVPNFKILTRLFHVNFIEFYQLLITALDVCLVISLWEPYSEASRLVSTLPSLSPLSLPLPPPKKENIIFLATQFPFLFTVMVGLKFGLSSCLLV